MKELLQACLNKEPQNVHPYTPTPTSIAISIGYKNGMVVEIVKSEGKTLVKAVEVTDAGNGQRTAKLKAAKEVSGDPDLLALAEEVWEKHFSQHDQDSTCEHWALMINGSKKGLEVTKK